MVDRTSPQTGAPASRGDAFARRLRTSVIGLLVRRSLDEPVILRPGRT